MLHSVAYQAYFQLPLALRAEDRQATRRILLRSPLGVGGFDFGQYEFGRVKRLVDEA